MTETHFISALARSARHSYVSLPAYHGYNLIMVLCLLGYQLIMSLRKIKTSTGSIQLYELNVVEFVSLEEGVNPTVSMSKRQWAEEWLKNQ